MRRRGASLTSASFNVEKFVVKNLSRAKVREQGESKPVDAHVLVNCKKTRMHSSRMRTARSSKRRGGGLQHVPPQKQTPWDHAPPSGPCTPQDHAPLPGPCTSPLRTEFLTHAYENITLPQTSFSGGNKIKLTNFVNCRELHALGEGLWF